MRILIRGFGGVALCAIAALIVGCGGAEARKTSYLARGDKYFAEQNYDKARVEYRNALQIAPTDSQARYSVGRVSEKMGNPKDALGNYQAAIEVDPKHLQARAALARLFLFGGLPEKAMELAAAGLIDAPTNAQLLTVRAAVAAQKGNTEAAFTDAEAALKSDPKDEYAIALLASLYQRNVRSDKAIEVLRAGIEQVPTSVDLRIALADLEQGQKHPELAEAQLKKVIEMKPTELAHRFRLARFYLGSKDIDAAEKALREGIAADPKNPMAKLALVETLAAHRDAEAAERQLQAFVAESPKDDQLKLQLGAYYEQHEQFDKAEASYRAVIASSGVKPDGLAARNRLAASLLKRNASDQATPLIEEVLKENQRDNDALIMRGNLALARGDATTAITDLRSVLRDQPNAIPVMRALAKAHIQNRESALAEETLRNAVQLSPKDPDARLDLANMLMQSGRADQARPMIEQLASELPANIAIQESLFRAQALQKDFAAARVTAAKLRDQRPDLSLGHYLLGTIDEADRKPQGAIEHYERALALQPRGAETLTALVRLELGRKQPQQAMARLDKVLATDADNVVARNLRGELLISQRKYPEAIATYRLAIEKAPQWWIPYRGLAMAQMASKDMLGAAATLEQGSSKSNYAPSLLTELANLYERSGRLDDAIKVYDDWLQRDANSLLAVNNLAMLLANYKQDGPSLERARTLAAKLAASEEPAMLDTRGWVQFKSGDYAQAVELLEQASDKADQSPLLRYHLGMAQFKKGDKDAARRNLEAALNTNRSFLGVDEARATLQQIKQPS